MPQKEDISPIEEDDAGEAEEAQETKMQETNEKKEYVNNICGKEILQLKVNSILSGLTILEKLFDRNDVAKYPQLVPNYQRMLNT